MRSTIDRLARTAMVLLLGIAVSAETVTGQDISQLPEGDTCIECHVDIEEMPEGFLEHGVHMIEGLSCAGCHGGDPTSDDEEESMAESAGFIGVPSPQEIPEMCGKCHSDLEYMRAYSPRIRTDQVEQYYTSGHGARLKEGDTNVANCQSCHHAHGILPASDPRSPVYAINIPGMCNTCHGDAELMRQYGLGANQYEEYAASVHGIPLLEDEDIGAPACNDCHGNHGARPPEVASLAQVCGSCHANNELYFEQSAMMDPFQEDELHACIECHGYHDIPHPTDEMVGVGDESLCMNCHDEGEEAYDHAEAIYNHIKGLSTLNDSVATLRERVVRIGMDDVDIEYLLKDVTQSLVQARTLVHTFDGEKVGEETEKGREKAVEAIGLANDQFAEHRTRRFGFGLATLFISVLALALFLKIRDMERQGKT